MAITESELRKEIARRAPDVRILRIGPLFNRSIDAIVENKWGQHLWSAYESQLESEPTQQATQSVEPADGQLSLF